MGLIAALVLALNWPDTFSANPGKANAKTMTKDRIPFFHDSLLPWTSYRFIGNDATSRIAHPYITPGRFQTLHKQIQMDCC